MDFLDFLELLNRLTRSRKHQKIKEFCHSSSAQEWAQDSASPLITLLVVSSELTTASSKVPTSQYVSTEIARNSEIFGQKRALVHLKGFVNHFYKELHIH